MKKKCFLPLFSLCLAMISYTPINVSAESEFISYEADDAFVSEDDILGAEDNQNMKINDETDDSGFIDSEEYADSNLLETFDTEEDSGYIAVSTKIPIEFKYEGTTLYFRLKEGNTEAKLPDCPTVVAAKWARQDMEANAQAVTKIVIGNGITAIGKNNFCAGGNQLFENLAEVEVPSTLKEIGFGAFQGDSKLTKFDFSNLKSIGSVAFAGTGLTDVSIPSDGVVFGDEAFYDCEKLSSVTIGNSELSEGIFSDCSSLTNLHYESKLVDIPASAFQRTALSSFDFNGIESIGAKAFQGTRLETINLPNVKKIERNAFLSSAVKTISFGMTDLSVDGSAFSNCNDLAAICYAGSREQWKNLAISASVPENVQIHCKADSVEPKAATCIETGLKEVGECKVCGEHYSYADDENVLPVDTVNGHNWSEDYVVDQEATCTEPGSKSKHCTREGCDAKNDTQEIKALGHDYVSKVTKEATCTEKGILTKTCSRCNDVLTEEIQALGHDFAKDYTVDVKATCTTDGKQSKHCSRCDAKTDVQKIPALGHDFTSKVTKEATCTVDGVITKSCGRCAATETEVIKATGHKFGDWKVAVEATVFVPEQQERICETCGEKETKTVGTALKATATVNASSVKLKVKQSTSGLKVTGLAKGDSVKTWKSTNTKIFTVKGNANGTCKLTAKKAGTAKLQITLASGLKKTVTVKVQKSNVKTTKVSVSSKNVSVKKGKKVTLKPVVTPFTSKQKVTYTSSNKKVATVSAKGVVTGKKKGTAKITIKSGSKSVKVTVRVK